MLGILRTKLKNLIRNPGEFILMTLLSIIFALIFGGNDLDQIKVPTYIEHPEKGHHVVAKLEEENVFTPEIVTDREQLIHEIRSGRSEFGIIVEKDEFEVIVGIDSHNVFLLEQSVRNIYTEIEQYNVLAAATNIENVEETLKNERIFEVESTLFQGDDTFIYERNLHSIFGFTLFFVIFTIAYSVFQVLVEKNSGIWDRLIISPVKKWEMYVANFLYSFFVGYLQVMIVFYVFKFIVKIDFQGSFLLVLFVMIPYVLAIVALAIFMVSVVKTVQQFNALVPIVSVSFSMIGGAYWPLEIVTSQFMITLSKFVPVTYGMELLNGMTVYNYTLEETLFPIGILLLMTVLLTGIGIHLMEKRYVS